MEPYNYEEVRVKLDKFKFVVLQRLSDELVDTIVNEPKVDVSIGDFIGESMARAVFEMMGCEMERVECRWPADWWQAFKQRWFPRWALKHWPVQEEVRQLVARELYPKVKLPDTEPMIALRIE